MSHLNVTDLDRAHLPGAAEMFARSVRALRSEAQQLPAKYEDPASSYPLLEDLQRRYPGVAAVEDGELAGYLLGFPIASFKGLQRGVYSPEWANGAGGRDPGRIYQEMYRVMANRWVANGGFTHAISVMSGNQAGLDMLFWNGFGILVVDAIRSLEPVGCPLPPGMDIRRACLGDFRDVRDLVILSERHLASTPVFLPLIDCVDESEIEKRLLDRSQSLWLAFHGNEPVAYMRAEKRAHGAAQIVYDEESMAITGAYTREDHRGTGIASALLDRALAWGRSQGMTRCSVDFEGANSLGRRFWMRYFDLVSYSLVRVVDSRIAWAGEDRDPESMW